MGRNKAPDHHPYQFCPEICDYGDTIEMEKYINRLRQKRHHLQSINKYLKKARDVLWKRYLEKEDLDIPEFNILIAVEQLWHYLEKELNRELLKHGQNRVKK